MTQSKKHRITETSFHRNVIPAGVIIVLFVVFSSLVLFNDKFNNRVAVVYDTIIEDPTFYEVSMIPDWHIINLRSFKIQSPNRFKAYLSQGIDSYVGGITDGIDTLYFDFGNYSNDLSYYENEPSAMTSFVSIQSVRFKIVRDSTYKGLAGAYSNDLRGDKSLMIICASCTNLDEKVAMFRTIEFSDRISRRGKK